MTDPQFKQIMELAGKFLETKKPSRAKHGTRLKKCDLPYCCVTTLQDEHTPFFNGFTFCSDSCKLYFQGNEGRSSYE